MTVLRIPSGTKDVLPTEAAELRLIEESVRTVFEEFGYGEVRTPTLEFEDVVALSESAALLGGFRMLDELGHLLLLRPDLTTPVARLVASRYRRGVLPHRLFAISDVFRRISLQRGQESEFRQAGVELLGSALPQTDAEVIAVACRSLERAGLGEYTVGVGHLAFFTELLEALALETGVRERLTEELVERDLVGFRLAVENLPVSAEDRAALLEVPELRGGPEVLDHARRYVRSPAMAAALDHLVVVAGALDAYGYGDRLFLDLGIFRDLTYYTGIVFEVYAAGLGFTLGGGGRYDRLLERFGAAMPAVGFGLGLDRLHVALVEQGHDFGPAEPAVLMVGGLDRYVVLADRVRAACVAVFALPADMPAADVPVLARQKDIPILVEPVPGSEGMRWTVTDLRGGLSEATPVEGLLALVSHAAFEHEPPLPSGAAAAGGRDSTTLGGGAPTGGAGPREAHEGWEGSA